MRAEELDVEMNKLAELAFAMQKSITSEHVASVNKGLPELDRMLREYIRTVSQHYNPAPTELPVQPDMEIEGRWKPFETDPAR